MNNEITIDNSLKFLTFEHEGESSVVIFNGSNMHKNIAAIFQQNPVAAGFIRINNDDSPKFGTEGWSSSLSVGSNSQDDIPANDVVYGVELRGGTVLLCTNKSAVISAINEHIYSDFGVIVSEDKAQVMEIQSPDYERIENRLNSFY